MHSLTNLNRYGKSTFELTDTRDATVTFSRTPPLFPIDQIENFISTEVTILPGTEVIEIINYEIANARYQIKINSPGTPALVGSTIVFPTLPSYMSLTIEDDTYTISGLKSVDDWNIIRSFTWSLPTDYNLYPNFYLDVSVLYYSEELSNEVSVDWLVYDPRYYYVGKFQSNFSSSINGRRVRTSEDNIINSSFTQEAISTKYKGTVPLIFPSTFTFIAEGNINVDKLNSNFSVSSIPNVTLSGGSTTQCLATLTSVVNTSYPLSSTLSPGYYPLAISSDGTHISIQGKNYSLISDVWSQDTSVDIFAGTDCDLSDDGNYLFTTSTAVNGHIKIYSRSGQTWTLSQTITAPSSDGTGDISASSNGQYFCVIYGVSNYAPTPRVYYKNTTTWALQSSLTVTPIETTYNVYSQKCAISSDGDVIAYGYRANTEDLIKIKIFTRSGTTWTQTSSFTYSTTSTTLFNDLTISGDGHTIVASIGTGGYNEIVTWSNSGGTWQQVNNFVRSSGVRLDINSTGDILVVSVVDAFFIVYKRFNGSFNWKEVYRQEDPGTNNWGANLKMSKDGNYIITNDYVSPTVNDYTYIYKLTWI